MKRSFLERDIAWTEVTEKERKNYELSEYTQKKRLEILQIKNKSKNINIRLNSLQKKLENLQSGEISLFKHRLYLEREKTRHEVNVLLKNQNYEELSGIQKLQEELRVCERKLEELEPLLNSSNAKMRLDDINGSFKTLVQVWNQKINFNKSDLKEHIKNSEKQLKKLDVQILGIEEKLSNQHTDVEKVNRDILNCKIRSALLNYREKLHLKSLEKLRKKMQQSLKELREALKNAEQTGLRIVTTKNIEALLDEIRLTDGHLGALTDVSDDVEQRYESYSKLYLELKERVRTTTENRKKALKEVETRMNMWRTVIRSLLVRINRRYRKILSKAQATGRVRLVNEQDIEESGLEMLVGFKGVKPVPLDAYIQSGGERSTATMVFLLAVQQHIKSPFRAVDEYDVHMDPKNREIIADVLISSLKGSDAQYLAITPSQVSFAGKGVHVVAIQNVEGTSIFKKMI
jgi:chromosome segregation ATPase